MNDGVDLCQFVVDCAGLHEISTTSSNSLKSTCLDHLSKGIIAVPSRVWQEFENLYEEEAASIAPYVNKKINMKTQYLVGAASLADQQNSHFPMSPYDDATDYFAASICAVEGYTLITASSQIVEYAKMDFFSVVDVSALAAM